MAGAGAAEDSEPLFVLEPLPELSNVIDSFFGANLFALSGGLILMTYFIIKFEDPLQKLWTVALTNVLLNYYITDSLFYSMIFTSALVLVFVMVWAAIRWEDVKKALGIDRARILSIISFIVCTWILVVLGYAIGMPTGAGIVICASVTAYLWWTYYSLEPARV